MHFLTSPLFEKRPDILLAIATLARLVLSNARWRVGQIWAAVARAVVPRMSASLPAVLFALPQLLGQPALVPSQPNPATVTVSQPITPITFTVTEMSTVGSWRLQSALPAGLMLSAREKPSEQLTGPGVIDATEPPTDDGYGYPVSPGNATTTPMLTGTPMQAGTYTISLQAYQLGGTAGTSTAVFSYTINVVSASTGGGSAGSAPIIARHPTGAVIARGSTAVLSADIAGASTYQWRKDGATVAGAINSTLVIRSAGAADAGSYVVTATNPSGSVTSNVATLALSDNPRFGHLINLSIRTRISSADPFFTLGTSIGGGSAALSKRLLVRAVGPTLAVFGVSAALADSKLEVLSGANVIASNDDWGDAAALSTVFAQVGAFALASGASKDAAIFNPSLPAGSYTVQVSGVGSGEVLAELYDADPSTSFSANTPRLVNVSVRKYIEMGGTLTAGFVVDGATARTVLIRAIGPGLAAFGLSGFMADPQLALNSRSGRIASNDNWGGDGQITAAGNTVGAFTITNASSRDAMLLITLDPGGYTVDVTGVNGSSGETLIEIYEVP